MQAAVDDEFLERIGIEKGGRRIISLEERAQILELLDGQYQVSLSPCCFLGMCAVHAHNAYLTASIGKSENFSLEQLMRNLQ